MSTHSSSQAKKKWFFWEPKIKKIFVLTRGFQNKLRKWGPPKINLICLRTSLSVVFISTTLTILQAHLRQMHPLPPIQFYDHGQGTCLLYFCLDLNRRSNWKVHLHKFNARWLEIIPCNWPTMGEGGGNWCDMISTVNTLLLCPMLVFRFQNIK